MKNTTKTLVLALALAGVWQLAELRHILLTLIQ